MPQLQLCSVPFFPEPWRAVTLGERTQRFLLTWHPEQQRCPPPASTAAPRRCAPGDPPALPHPPPLPSHCLCFEVLPAQQIRNTLPLCLAILIKQFHLSPDPGTCLWLNPRLTGKREDHSGALLCQNQTKSHLWAAFAKQKFFQ